MFAFLACFFCQAISGGNCSLYIFLCVVKKKHAIHASFLSFFSSSFFGSSSNFNHFFSLVFSPFLDIQNAYFFPTLNAMANFCRIQIVQEAIKMYLPLPNGTFDEVVFALVATVAVVAFVVVVLLSSFACAVVACILFVVVTMVAFVGCVTVDCVVWALRKSKIDCDLSIRFSVCNRIGPSDVWLLLTRCWTKIEPSGMFAVVAEPDVTPLEIDAVDTTVAVVDFLIVDGWNITAFEVDAFDVAVADDIDLIGDWIKMRPFASPIFVVFIRCVVWSWCCCWCCWTIIDLSSSLAIKLPPLVPFNRFNNSWLFCSIIWPFSVRAPRIKMMFPCCCIVVESPPINVKCVVLLPQLPLPTSMIFTLLMSLFWPVTFNSFDVPFPTAPCSSVVCPSEREKNER